MNISPTNANLLSLEILEDQNKPRFSRVDQIVELIQRGTIEGRLLDRVEIALVDPHSSPRYEFPPRVIVVKLENDTIEKVVNDVFPEINEYLSINLNSVLVLDMVIVPNISPTDYAKIKTSNIVGCGLKLFNSNLEIFGASADNIFNRVGRVEVFFGYQRILAKFFEDQQIKLTNNTACEVCTNLQVTSDPIMIPTTGDSCLAINFFDLKDVLTEIRKKIDSKFENHNSLKINWKIKIDAAELSQKKDEINRMCSAPDLLFDPTQVSSSKYKIKSSELLLLPYNTFLVSLNLEKNENPILVSANNAKHTKPEEKKISKMYR